MTDSPLNARRCGILLHPTSLPGPFGLGDLGPSSRHFVDFLAEAGQSIWQMLPVHPIGGGNSPYDSPSAFAGGLHLLSPEDLVSEGWVAKDALLEFPRAPEGVADFELRDRHLKPLLRRAHDEFQSAASHDHRHLYEEFIETSQSWVWDYALFAAVKKARQRQPFLQWPAPLRHREPEALRLAHEEYQADVRLEVFSQFLFDHQWRTLRAHAHSRGVRLLGDIPMFVAHDSVDVWANQHMFYLDGEGERTVQAGVPPDYFSAEGQLWGNPLYRWDVMRADGYGWFIDRLRRELLRFDAVRLDHFIAFHRYWEVPMGASTAQSGCYRDVPGADFLARTRDALGDLPLIAEDLGIITHEVEQLRDQAGLPGMRILQFAFNKGAESYLPHRHPERCVAYTGTHDNNTTRGFFDELVREAAVTSGSLEELARAVHAREQLERIGHYTGATHSKEVCWAWLRCLLSSPARTVIFPLQDALEQGGESRMNQPGTPRGNWSYRFTPGKLTTTLAARLRGLVEVTERWPGY